MAVPQLTNSLLVTFTFKDGDCEQIQTQIGAELDHDSMPMTTADGALLYDFSGVKKIISLQGKLSEASTTRTSSGTVKTIDEQRQWLEANLNGNQTGLTFVSNYSSTYNGSIFIPSPVLISQITFTEVTGNPAALEFNITLFVGDV